MGEQGGAGEVVSPTGRLGRLQRGEAGGVGWVLAASSFLYSSSGRRFFLSFCMGGHCHACGRWDAVGRQRQRRWGAT